MRKFFWPSAVGVKVGSHRRLLVGSHLSSCAEKSTWGFWGLVAWQCHQGPSFFAPVGLCSKADSPGVSHRQSFPNEFESVPEEPG